MNGRPTDHKNQNLNQLQSRVIRNRAGGQILWQPRILCWYHDKLFTGEGLPAPYTGMSQPDFYRALGCSNRIYEYSACFDKLEDPAINKYTRTLNELETEYVVETPVGKISSVLRSNTSNYGIFPSKWWITCEEDMKVAIWLEERTHWRWNQSIFNQVYAEWGDIGSPTAFLPRVNIQSLFIDTMGVEEAIYALQDYPDTVHEYFRVMHENHKRLIEEVNRSPIEVINFGDNLHGGILPPELFKKFVLPAYQDRNELLHKAGKFTHSHWDGDTKPLLPFARECGLDGIEAITPVPQGDVTLEEVKEALGDEVYLVDGIAAILFDELYPEEALVEQTKRIIELFAPKLILGISDEMPSRGKIERVLKVGEMVDDYNARVSR